MKKVAIIGAGVSGLTLARLIKNYAKVVVFEKSRSFGGRVCTRRQHDFHFDHGAQYFVAKSDEFKKFILPAIKEKVIQPWLGTFYNSQSDLNAKERQWTNEYPHYVGVPSMSMASRWWSRHVYVIRSTPVTCIEKLANKWRVLGQNQHVLGDFDWVISATPNVQMLDIFPREFIGHHEMSQVKMEPCFTLMLGFNQVLNIPFAAHIIKGHSISWIANNSSKPQRPAKTTCLVINSSNKWAQSNLHQNVDWVIHHLKSKVTDFLDLKLPLSDHCDLQIWRYANFSSEKKDITPYHIDPKLSLGCCGDWCIQGRVEAAFQSGFKLSQELLQYL